MVYDTWEKTRWAFVAISLALVCALEWVAWAGRANRVFSRVFLVMISGLSGVAFAFELLCLIANAHSDVFRSFGMFACVLAVIGGCFGFAVSLLFRQRSNSFAVSTIFTVALLAHLLTISWFFTAAADSVLSSLLGY